MDSRIGILGTTVQKRKIVPCPKRDIAKLPISFGFHGKLETVGNLFLAESYQTKFNATFFILVSTDLS